MTSIIIELAGAVVAKGRPRFARRGVGQRPIAFTPAKTRSYEGALKYAAQQAMGGRPLLTGPLTMKVTATLPLLKAFSAKKRQAAIEGQLLPTTRPDVDNYAKIAADALNCIVFGDDAQITSLSVRKIYGEHPGLRIEIGGAA